MIAAIFFGNVDTHDNQQAQQGIFGTIHVKDIGVTPGEKFFFHAGDFAGFILDAVIPSKKIAFHHPR